MEKLKLLWRAVISPAGFFGTLILLAKPIWTGIESLNLPRDFGDERRPRGVRHDGGIHLAAPIKDAEHDGLARTPATALTALPLAADYVSSTSTWPVSGGSPSSDPMYSRILCAMRKAVG